VHSLKGVLSGKGFRAGRRSFSSRKRQKGGAVHPGLGRLKKRLKWNKIKGAFEKAIESVSPQREREKGDKRKDVRNCLDVLDY